MNKWTELIVGLVLLIGTILIAGYFSIYNQELGGINFNFLSAAWIFLKGGIFWFIILIGFLFILLGISDLKG